MNNEEFFSSFKFIRIKPNRHNKGGNMSKQGCVTNFLGRLLYGTGKLVSQGTTVMLSAGETVFIPKGCRYESFWTPDENSRLEWDSIGFDYFPQADKGTYLLQKVEFDGRATELLNAVTEQMKVTPYTVGKLYELLDILLPKMQRQVGSQDLITENAVKYMRDDPFASMSEVAAACHVSESWLYTVFKESLHISPNEMRQKILCEKAEELLLSTGLSVEEISNELQFSSSSYFRKILKKHLGKTPSDIRRTNGV